jgi:hypothetical protein
MKILFIESWLHNPHIETAFEISQSHLDIGDQVFFYFAGHDLDWKDGMNTVHRLLFQSDASNLPERRLAKLIKNSNFRFKKRVSVNHHLSFKGSIPESEIDLVGIKYKGCNIGLAALSSLIHELKWSTPNLKLHKKQIESMLTSGMQSYDLAVDLINKHQPDLIYLFNGRFVNTRSIMEAAISTNTAFRVHERGCNMYHYSVRSYMPHHFEKLQNEIVEIWNRALSIDPTTATNVGHDFYRSRRQGKEQSWFSMTKEQVSGVLPEIKSDKKIITFFTSSDDEYRAVGDIVKWKTWTDQNHCLSDVIDICSNDKNIQLVVRIHPHMKSKHPLDLQAIQNLFVNKLNIIVISPDSPIDSYALIESSDLVITTMSTIGIESVYWGTPSICMGPSCYNTLGAVMVPDDILQLRAFLKQSVHPRADRCKTLSFGYYMNTFGTKFKYYQPYTLQSGEYMSVNVQFSCPPLKTHERIIRKTTAQLHGWARRTKSILLRT